MTDPLKTAREALLQIIDTSRNWKYATGKPIVSYADDLIAIEGIAKDAISTLDQLSPGKFKLGDLVTKTKGSSWTGHVVGSYTTKLTPIGYAVESINEPGSVQIYPEAALTQPTEGEFVPEMYGYCGFNFSWHTIDPREIIGFETEPRGSCIMITKSGLRLENAAREDVVRRDIQRLLKEDRR